MNPKYPRRTFLKLSSAVAGGIYLEGLNVHLLSRSFLETIPDNLLKNSPDFYAALFSEAQTQELEGERVRSVRTFQALAEIWRLSIQANNADPLEHEKIAKKIETIIAQGQRFDPDTFGELSSFLAGGSLDAIKNAQTYGSYAGKIMGTAGLVFGLFPGPINMGASLALSLGGIWAEDAIVTLAKPGLNLAFLPITEPDRISLLNKMVYAKVAETYQREDQFKALADNAKVNERIGIDFSESFEGLIGKLPEQIKDIVESTIGADIDQIKSSTERTNELIEALSDQVSNRFDKLDTKTDEILRILKDSEKNKALQENYQRQLQYVKNEVQGAVAVGATVLNAIFGNQTARVFEGSCQAVITISNALSQVVAGTMGPLGLASAFVSAGKLLFGLFSDHPSEFDTLLAHIDRVEQRIIALGQYIDARLNQIDRRQKQTIELVSSVLREVLRGNKQAHEHFVEIERNFREFEKLYLEVERANKLIEYAKSVSGCADFLGNTSFPDLSNTANFNKYQRHLNDFYTHATETSKHPAFCAAMPSDADTLDEVQSSIAKLTRDYRRPELLFNLLPEMSRLLGLSINIGNLDSSEPDKGQLRNPWEWVRGTEHYLQARMHSVSTFANPERVKALWSQGVRLREAAVTAGSSKGLRRSTTRYLESAFRNPTSGGQTLTTHLARLIDDWSTGIDEQGQPNLQQFRFQDAKGTVPNKKVYRIKLRGEHVPPPYVLFEIDPLEVALDRGLITRSVVETRTDLSSETVVYKYQLKIDVNEANASAVTRDVSQTVVETRYFSENRIEVRDPVGDFGLDSLLSACVYLFREIFEYDKVRLGLGKWIRTELKNINSTVDAFECYAGIAKVFSCLNALCSTRYGDFVVFLDTKNIPIFSDRDQVADWLVNYLLGDWFIRQQDYSSISTLVSKFQAAAKAPTPEPVSQYLLSKFSEDLRVQIKSSASAFPQVPDSLQYQLTIQLNQLLQDPKFYDENRFKAVTLSTEAKSLLGKKLSGNELIRFNRLLLESAYKGAIASVPDDRRLPISAPVSLPFFEDTVFSLPWKNGIVSAFKRRMLEMTKLLYEQADYSNGLQLAISGPLFIDEVLRRLNGFMSINGVAFDQPSIPNDYPHYAVGEYVFGELLKHSDDGFTAVKDQLVSSNGGFTKYTAKTRFPGADETSIFLDSNDTARVYCECLFTGSKYETGNIWFRQLTSMIESLRSKGWSLSKPEGPICIERLQASPDGGDVRLEMSRLIESDGYRIKLHFLSPKIGSILENDERPFKERVCFLIEQRKKRFTDIEGEEVGLYPTRWKANIEVPGFDELFVGYVNMFDRTDGPRQCYGIANAREPRSTLKRRLVVLSRFIQLCTPGWSHVTNAGGTQFVAKESDKGPFVGLRVLNALLLDSETQLYEVANVLLIKFVAPADD